MEPKVPDLLLASRLRRKIAWVYVRWFLYLWPVVRGSFFALFYRLIFPNFRLGAKAKIWGRFQVTMYDSLNSSITIGENLHMVSDPRRAGITLYSECKFTTLGKATITIGDSVGLNGVAITSRKRIEIGDNTLIAPNTIIVDSDFHNHWPPERRHAPLPPEADRAVKIGKNVWISMNVTILKGVEIGNNSIIGAGSVVTSSIPANVIAAGNPARVIRALV